MAARVHQPSEYDIQREVEALKDLRRRSTTPGALTIDPDLPAPAPTVLWPAKLAASPVSTSSSSPDSSSLGHSDDDASSRTSDAANNAADDPLHLFWVPASLHPEIAPAEFRAFLKEHARSPVDPADPSSSSLSPVAPSASLSRKKSMLSRQYRPKENDGVENENIVPLKRNRSLLYPTNQGPQLTISDLRMLEELVEEASESADPSKLRNVLRRSLSLNISPSAAEMMDGMADIPDEADAPIIVPPPGQILRRAARTKIRKPGLQGDGGGHRFPASRRGTKHRAATAPGEPRTSSDISSSDHGDPDLPARRLTLSDEGPHMNRPESYSEENAIYDAYARDDDEEEQQHYSGAGLVPVPIVEPPTPQPQPPPAQAQPDVPQQPAPVLHQPQPQRLMPPSQEQTQPSRTPSPTEPPVVSGPTLIPTQPPPPAVPPVTGPSTPSPVPTPAPAQGRKEKEKEKEKGGKGLFKWSSDKSGKKAAKEKEKEKDSGFFGSLFGGKKKQEQEYTSSMTGGTSGREAAQALLGASKSKAYQPPVSPGLAPGIGGNPYARYPIHVERAIYRLSHIKLANPRRPLYEQVLISNLMFWYLGVINKAQNPTPPTPVAENATAPANGAAGAGAGEQGDSAEREERERAQREKEAREKEAREKAEEEQREREREQREAENRKRESGRRGSLTKTPAGGPPGTRRAEMPIKGPQYEMQHRVIEQEYSGYAAGPSPNGSAAGPPRNPAAPTNGHVPQQQRGPQPGPYNGPPQSQAQPRGQPDGYYYQPPADHRGGLPPGAMQPTIDQPGWGGQPVQQRQRASPPPTHHYPQKARHPSPGPGPHRRSHSPPQHHAHAPYPVQGPGQGQKQASLHRLNTSQENLGLGEPRGSSGRAPGRSLSATAYSAPAPPQANGATLRKGNSAHAAAPYERRPRSGERRNSEEEDVPLAVWQQQRRK